MNAIVKQDSLIPVVEYEIDGEIRLCVDARTLHAALGVGRMFSGWINGRIKEYKFQEGSDYIIVQNLSYPKKDTSKSRPQIKKDYFITLDMAKELGMVEKTDQGRAVRRYFIEQEKIARDMVYGIQIEINKAMLKLEHVTDVLSNAGRTLCVMGKQVKPQLMQTLDDLVARAQPQLPFEGSSND
ncbi:phage antirepressor Ant [Acinetobacter lwoffii]|uniref:phage antirepressor Ant n=1 Tax=Acinetobacter lwoffii TaxID=28090 RepID=UPI0002D06E69|nr:phage antirepressor Ant [Acinetobacter lwoffii]ENW29370.1 hypothetical protein F924_00934 [Acinetobacter lwoffii ATCC 9957 = CIP 70.31]